MNDRIEGWRNEVPKQLGLLSHQIQFLNDVISSIAQFCDSIILVGSWSRRCADNESDLDLLIVTPDSNSKEQVLSNVKKHQKVSLRLRKLCDFKVITKAELDRGQSSSHFFVIWTWLRFGRVLYGSEIGNCFDLDKEKLADVLSDLSRRMEDCSLRLGEYSMFRGSCVILIEALNTIFFIEQTVFEDQPRKVKTDFLRYELGDFYHSVMKIYYEITTSQWNNVLGITYRFSRQHDRKYSTEFYDQLLRLYQSTEIKINNLRKRLYSAT